jgi:nucleoside-diphosphate-sugar epimerase
VAGTALFTGRAGFIGSHLSELLLADGWDVYALDDLSTGSPENVADLRSRPDFPATGWKPTVLLDAILAEVIDLARSEGTVPLTT